LYGSLAHNQSFKKVYFENPTTASFDLKPYNNLKNSFKTIQQQSFSNEKLPLNLQSIQIFLKIEIISTLDYFPSTPININHSNKTKPDAKI